MLHKCINTSLIDFLFFEENERKITSSSGNQYYEYRKDPKFSDSYAWTNSADLDQTAPRFRLHRLDSSLYGRAT